jgi:hypothetical protein
MRCGRCQTGRLALSTAAGGAVPKGALAGAGEGAAGEGGGTAAARPPRTPSAYQRFLADNRKTVAATMPPGTTPQQVMSAVARLWAQHKAAVASAGAASDTAPRIRAGALAEGAESGSDVEHDEGDEGDEVVDVTDKMARTLLL